MNDNAPIILTPPLAENQSAAVVEFEMPYRLPPPIYIYKLEATDSDAGLNGQVSFHILQIYLVDYDGERLPAE